MDKNFKIWGVSYGLIGDLIMGLPVLTYFEKKYPGSYKYWGIEKKCAIAAPLFLNHPLIDRIHISAEWGAFGSDDFKIINSCNVKTVIEGWKHDLPDWPNYRGQVEETARVAGITDLLKVLTVEEQKPRLYRWFDVGLIDSAVANTGSKRYKDKILDYSKTVSIWPFSTSCDKRPGVRSPSEEWWRKMIQLLISQGFVVFHFGRPDEPTMSDSENYKNYTHIPFFESIKLTLATKVAIGTDSGPSWVISAYDHPCVVTLTNWFPGHRQNFNALAPVGDKVEVVFETGKCDNINQQSVLEAVKKFV